MEKKSKQAEPISRVAVVLTLFEAAVIGQLRKFNYGELVIKKQRGVPYQMISSESRLVQESDGLNLPESFGLTQDMLSGKVDLSKLFDTPKTDE